MKNYSISIPLSGEVYRLAKECQKKIYGAISIKSTWIHNAEPHLNLISGTTNDIDNIIKSVKKFEFEHGKYCDLLGIGVLITPNPLIHMRFTSSLFLKEFRLNLFNETLQFWDSLTNTVNDDMWMPKSTLAFKDFTLNDLTKALIPLKDMKFQLRMEISEISIIDFTEHEHEVRRVAI